MNNDILLQVHRPAQYLGNEWNASKKDFSLAALTFALGFPDLYEGRRLLYRRGR